MPTAKGCALVLVIEDEWGIAELITRIMTSFGCRVLGPAVGVAEALRLLDQELPDAIVLDPVAADEVGYLIADSLLESGIPFTLLTSRSREQLPFGYAECHHLSRPLSEISVTAEVLALLKLPASPSFWMPEVITPHLPNGNGAIDPDGRMAIAVPPGAGFECPRAERDVVRGPCLASAPDMATTTTGVRVERRRRRRDVMTHLGDISG